MKEELADFLQLSAASLPLTCTAYERDVSACLGYLESCGLDLAEVKDLYMISN
jgi:hypothetical protein